MRQITYTQASVASVAATVALDFGVLRTRLVARRSFWTAYSIVLAAQLVTNGILTGREIVTYNPELIAGPRVAYAPVEDLGFGFALVTSAMACWVWLGRRAVAPRRSG